MNGNRPNTYRFFSAAHWKQCVLHRFDQHEDMLRPIVRVGLRAWQTAIPGALSLLAIDPRGTLNWRVRNGSQRRLQVFDDFGNAGPLRRIDSALQRSSRWITDGSWLWAFDSRRGKIFRYEADTAELDLVVNVGQPDPLEQTLPEGAVPRVILDIASDGRDGLWALLSVNDSELALLRIDCRGCVGKPQELRASTCGSFDATQIASVDRGADLVLLTAGGTSLVIIDAATGDMKRTVRIGQLGLKCHANRLVSDGKNRIALWCHEAPGVGGQSMLFLLDRSGDTIDGPLTDLFNRVQRRDAKGRIAAGGQKTSANNPIRVRDLAVSRGTVWFATVDGLWQLDSTDKSGVRESESELLTPVLESPPSSTGRGWLRAEVDVALPRGTVLEACFASTNDSGLVEQIRQLQRDPSKATGQRQQAVWNQLEQVRHFRFAGTGSTSSIAIPLFESQDRWLWLGLKIVNSPGVAPPAVRELRVLYPDLSIAQNLPPIFFDANDSDGFMRKLVGVLETTTQQIDARIRSIGRQIDPKTAPAEEWLDYLAQWLGVPWDNALPEDVKRAILSASSELIAERGTRTGLLRLGKCLFGANAISVVDLTVDHAPARISNGTGTGSVLPALLAGMSPRAATLGAKAVLGRAQIMCASSDCNPLKEIVPTVYIDIVATPSTRSAIEPLLASLLHQYIPAGVTSVIHWRAASRRGVAEEGGADAILILDGNGPGTLGADSIIGRTLLAGRSFERISEYGAEIGFRLR